MINILGTSPLIILKFGEIALKGLNKNKFSDILIKNLRSALSAYGKFTISHAQSTVYAVPTTDISEENFEKSYVAAKKIFGFSSICVAYACPKDMNSIYKLALELTRKKLAEATSNDIISTFRITGKRADKKFPFDSVEIAKAVGYEILKEFPGLSVDLHEPDITVYIDIRESHAYVYIGKESSAGGLPVGSSGTACVMLSGGIDSPVAAYLAAKRGMRIVAVHFQSPPYTSERAFMKVQTLCEKLKPYTGFIKLIAVNFTEIQEAIKNNCPHEYFTIIMRRLMMTITQKIAKDLNCQIIVTGESLGQVASQTPEAMMCTDNFVVAEDILHPGFGEENSISELKNAELSVFRLPIIRPCVCMDKCEITDIARFIDTFETSVLPYEDCCTVFTPKHPKLKPTLDALSAAESKFNFSELISKVFADIKY